MAAPSILSIATTSLGSSTSHVVSLPSGIVAGDKLFVLASFDGYPTVTGEGWDQLVYIGGSYNRLALLFKEADGTEGANVTLTTDKSEDSSFVAWRMSSGTRFLYSTGINGTTANPDPDALDTSAWGSVDTLFIAAAGSDGRTFSAYPTGYDTDQTTIGDCALASKAGTSSASEDPASFTISSSDQWSAFTLAFSVGDDGIDPYARVTQQYVEAAVASTTSPNVRITQQYVEAACLAVTVTPPTGTSLAATDVADTSVTLNGSATLGDESTVNVYFQYRVVGAGTWSETTPVAIVADGSFSEAVTGLAAGEDYEFRAVVEYGGSYVYGDTLTFITSAATGPTLYLGSTAVTAIYIGSTPVVAVYVGDTLVG